MAEEVALETDVEGSYIVPASSEAVETVAAVAGS